MTNAAAERLKGAELEARYRIRDDLIVVANYAYHDARFTQYRLFDSDANAYVDVAGKQLPLSLRHLASAGIVYAPPHGFNTTLVLTYAGRRFLDSHIAAPVGGDATCDATLVYALGPYQL